MRRDRIVVGGVAAVASLVALSAALAAGGPPPLPRASSGARAELVASGVPTPTAFAFAKGHVFVSAFGSEEDKTPGGIFVLRRGAAVKLPGTAGGVSGLAWKNGTLFASVFPPGKLVAYSGWSGSRLRFASHRTIFTGPKRFPGLNGIAVGWDGRLYAGVSLTDIGDHNRSFRPYANSVISLRRDGTAVKTVATGLRQPWQLTFIEGVGRPFVTVLGQENLGRKKPPDYVILARDGDNYGFPACNWSKPAACKSFAKPIALFPAHSSPTGITHKGSTLYVALFNGTGRGPEVVSLPARGGRFKPVLTGFAAPVVAVGYSGGYLYVGDLTGSIYRLRV
jgi:hypothetical protein